VYWHLAHTTSFFESMVLVPHLSEYRVFDERFSFLFKVGVDLKDGQ